MARAPLKPSEVICLAKAVVAEIDPRIGTEVTLRPSGGLGSLLAEFRRVQDVHHCNNPPFFLFRLVCYEKGLLKCVLVSQIREGCAFLRTLEDLMLNARLFIAAGYPLSEDCLNFGGHRFSLPDEFPKLLQNIVSWKNSEIVEAPVPETTTTTITATQRQKRVLREEGDEPKEPQLLRRRQEFRNLSLFQLDLRIIAHTESTADAKQHLDRVIAECKEKELLAVVIHSTKGLDPYEERSWVLEKRKQRQLQLDADKTGAWKKAYPCIAKAEMAYATLKEDRVLIDEEIKVKKIEIQALAKRRQIVDFGSLRLDVDGTLRIDTDYLSTYISTRIFNSAPLLFAKTVNSVSVYIKNFMEDICLGIQVSTSTGVYSVFFRIVLSAESYARWEVEAFLVSLGEDMGELVDCDKKRFPYVLVGGKFTVELSREKGTLSLIYNNTLCQQLNYLSALESVRLDGDIQMGIWIALKTTRQHREISFIHQQVISFYAKLSKLAEFVLKLRVLAQRGSCDFVMGCPQSIRLLLEAVPQWFFMSIFRFL